MWKKLLELVYQDVKKILQLSEVTSVAAEYVELDNIIEFNNNYSKSLDVIEVTVPKRPMYSYGQRVRIGTFFSEFGSQFIGKEVKVCGWAKELRKAGKGAFYFIELSDGSSLDHLQVVVDKGIEGFEGLKGEGVGTSFIFVGTLTESPKCEQKYELKVYDSTIHSMKICGSCPQKAYPLPK